MGLGVSLIFSKGKFGPCAFITIGYNIGFGQGFSNWLPKDCKKIVILTFQIGKLSPSNLGGVLMLSAMFTSDDKWNANDD